ncbi:hypothetical protein MMMDOFMJ_0172 [Methylobacterium gnaphalii]|nr:hypothetical protein MMMDOFMJ_0172 [Methylobacterium gnaphalii]
MTDINLQVSRLDLEDGDIIVVRSRSKLSPETAERYQDQVQALARAHGFRQVSVVVLDDCSDLSIEPVAKLPAMQRQAERTAPVITR